MFPESLRFETFGFGVSRFQGQRVCAAGFVADLPYVAAVDMLLLLLLRLLRLRISLVELSYSSSHLETRWCASGSPHVGPRGYFQKQHTLH